MNVSFLFFLKCYLFYMSCASLCAMDITIPHAITVNQGLNEVLIGLEDNMLLMLIDNIPTRSFDDNLKLFNTKFDHIEKLKTLYKGSEVDVNKVDQRISLFREKLIEQGCTQNVEDLKKISWHESEIHKNILKDIFVEKIIKLNLVTLTSSEFLKEEVQTLDLIQQLDVIAAFSKETSFKTMYTAYKHLIEQHVAREALKTYALEEIKKYLKNRLPQLAFVCISIVFWYLWPKLEKKYSKDIIYLYEAIAILLLNDYFRNKNCSCA